jgi:hypothetical protein
MIVDESAFLELSLRNAKLEKRIEELELQETKKKNYVEAIYFLELKSKVLKLADRIEALEK